MNLFGLYVPADTWLDRLGVGWKYLLVLLLTLPPLALSSPWPSLAALALSILILASAKVGWRLAFSLPAASPQPCRCWTLVCFLVDCWPKGLLARRLLATSYPLARNGVWPARLALHWRPHCAMICYEQTKGYPIMRPDNVANTIRRNAQMDIEDALRHAQRIGAGDDIFAVFTHGGRAVDVDGRQPVSRLWQRRCRQRCSIAQRRRHDPVQHGGAARHIGRRCAPAQLAVGADEPLGQHHRHAPAIVRARRLRPAKGGRQGQGRG